MDPGLLSAVAPTTSVYDSLLNWYLLFGVGAGVIVITMLSVYMVRYRWRGEKGPPPVHKTEGWKIVLVTVLISISILSFAEYQTFASFGNIQPVPSQCIETPSSCVFVGVSAFQWGWNFNYTNGKVLLNNLTVPAGKVVVLNINSKDVFHSFGISMLAVKEDAIPGKTNHLWFMVPDVRTPSAGVTVVCNQGSTSCFYDNAVRCFELCGVGHAYMRANLTVVGQPAWDAWIGSG